MSRKIIIFSILVIVIKSEEIPVLNLLENLMDPSTFYFEDKRSNFDIPSVEDMPDITVFSRILDQAESSH